MIYVIPIIFGVSLITFGIFEIMPGDPVLQKLGKVATQEDVDRLRDQMGLSGPFYERYGHFLKQIVTLDFGTSFATDEPIWKMFREGIPPSLTLTIPAFFGALFFSVVIALLLAFSHGKWIDHTVLGVCIFFMSISALSLIIGMQYFFAFKLGWFPVHGFSSGFEVIKNITLPVIIWIVLAMGPNIRLYRTVFLEEINKDYVRTAKAKGLDFAPILFKHVLKNAMIPVITNEVIAIPYLILGAFLLENFFGIPGVGDMLITAIPNSDYPVIKAFVVYVSFTLVLFNLISDILYSVVDPRVRLS